MAFEILRNSPQAAELTPLAVHQSQTPGSFFDQKPVLHFHEAGAILLAPRDQVNEEHTPAFSAFLQSQSSGSNRKDDVSEVSGYLKAEEINVWVTSERLILYRNTANIGISIPYPSISIHATQRLRVPGQTYNSEEETSDTLYMQITIDDPDQIHPDEIVNFLELQLVPSSKGLSLSDSGATSSSTLNGDNPTPTGLQGIFAAISACADLHPDPTTPLSEAGEELEQQLPGASGWITAENMNQFMDADGNFTGFGSLGAGAGTVRPRDGDDSVAEGADDTNGAVRNGDESKWRRLD